MRKVMIEQMVYKAMHQDLSLLRPDIVHSMDEFLPKGEKPLNHEEDEYLTERLLEENDKITEWPYIYGP